MQLTFLNNSGAEQTNMRRKDRENDDERIQKLFDGFDSRIATAKANGDQYGVGYLGAMRQEFGALIASLTP